jgi:membrane-associated phospholipid phosphatase
VSIYPQRFNQLLWGWGTVGVLYTLSQWTPVPAKILYENPLDQLIAFNPNAISWYLSFFILIPTAYFISRDEVLIHLRRSMQFASVIAAFVYILYPTTIITPNAEISGIFADTLKQLQSLDTAQNCLPSLHSALTLIATWGICNGEKFYWKMRSFIAVIWACLIVYSIIEVRRHLVVDVIAGLLLGALSLFASYKIK